jgi:putative DNA primase/helicase
MMGDYAKVAPIDTFTETKNDRHPTDMAHLRGARLVTAQETDEGKAWAEAKIKTLTGGDPVTARFMYGNFFTYTPQFTLMIAGNHKPRLRNSDEAMRRRMHMVPFTVKVPDNKRDPNLLDTLKTELPGILQWAIEGCIEWQRITLKPPSAVLDTTSEYFAGQDPLSGWLEDQCIPDPEARTRTAELYQSYEKHMRAAGEVPEGKDRFSGRLESHGFSKDRIGKNGDRGFRGIRVRPLGGEDNPLSF